MAGCDEQEQRHARERAKRKQPSASVNRNAVGGHGGVGSQLVGRKKGGVQDEAPARPNGAGGPARVAKHAGAKRQRSERKQKEQRTEKRKKGRQEKGGTRSLDSLSSAWQDGPQEIEV